MSLPAGWAEYQDSASGNPYFHCAATGETTWTRPSQQPVAADAFGSAATQPVGGGFVSTPGAVQQLGQQPFSAAQPQPLPAGWAEYKDPASGNQYFHCAGTGETTWTRPSGPGATFAAPAAMPFGGAQSGGGWTSGIVKNWDEERGFGFVDPIAGGDNVFVHRSALLDGTMLMKGATVQYEMTWNPTKGKQQVSKCTGAAGGTGPSGQPSSLPMDGTLGTGVVKTWFDDEGFGFITPNDGSKDCYCHRSFLLDGQSLVVGTTVSYTVQYDPNKNKNNATKVTGSVASGGKGPMPGLAPMGAPANSFGPVAGAPPVFPSPYSGPY